MKRHLILFAASLCINVPLMAQDPSYSGYESNDDSRQFNFNPGNMMNRMTNPMHGMFGSSRRGYDDYDYPGPGYPPPRPGYGYGYPGYQAPYPGYAQPNQVPPAPAQSTPYSYPSAIPVPAQPAAAAPSQPPVYDRPPAASQHYQPGFSQPDTASRYRFRPIGAEDKGDSPSPGETPVASPPQPAAPTSAAPSVGQPTPLAPLTYPTPASVGQPLAPISYPETSSQAAASPPPPAPQADPDLRFRPLDKPGYSSDLE